MSFKLSDPREKILLSCHPAWINVVFWLLFSGILFVMALVALFTLSSEMAGIVFTFSVLFAVNACILHYGSNYIITNKRVIVRKGLLSTRQDEVWIADMRGMSLNVALWQKIVGTGDVLLGTAATAGTEIVIRGISNPQHALDLINKNRRSVSEASSTSSGHQQPASSSGQVVYDPVTHQYVRK